LIIGGALGNLLDRVTTGEVLDFIQTPIRPGVFNIADVCINVGVVLSLLGAFFQKERKEEQGGGAELEDGVGV
jgi:signal peptidase II